MGSAAWGGGNLSVDRLGNNCPSVSSASTSSQRFEEAHFTFALTPQQVQQILTSRYITFSPLATSEGGYPFLLSDSLLPCSPPCLPSCTCFVSYSLVCLFSVPGYLTFSVTVYSPLPSRDHTLTPLPLLLCYREVLPGAKCDYTIQVQLR